MRRYAPAFRHYFGSSSEPDAVRWESHQFVRPRRLAGGRGSARLFQIRSGAVHPCGFIPERVEAHAAHPFFRLGQGSAKFAAVPEQFKNSSFTCGHSSPLSPDSLFSLPRWRAERRIGYEGQKKARAVRCCLPVSCCLCLPWPSLPRGRENNGENRQAATSSHGSRAYLAYSPESFRYPYFVNEPQTRGAAARPNTGGKRCSLSERLIRYILKNKQQNLL